MIERKTVISANHRSYGAWEEWKGRTRNGNGEPDFDLYYENGYVRVLPWSGALQPDAFRAERVAWLGEVRSSTSDVYLTQEGVEVVTEAQALLLVAAHKGSRGY